MISIIELLLNALDKLSEVMALGVDEPVSRMTDEVLDINEPEIVGAVPNILELFREVIVLAVTGAVPKLLADPVAPVEFVACLGKNRNGGHALRTMGDGADSELAGAPKT